MNEIEIVFFSIYLEYNNWDINIKLEDNIFLLCLYTKVFFHYFFIFLQIEKIKK